MDLSQFQVPRHVRGWITDGVPPGEDRSTYMYGAAKDLVRAGATREQAICVLADPEHDISEGALERRTGDLASAMQWIAEYCVDPAIDEVSAEPNPDTSGITGGSDWPELVTLDVAPPARLPVEEWPRLLRDYALGASAETETPPKLPAMLALGTVAAASQRLADVEIKPGYREPINIYTAVALPPATRKSAEFKRATKPLVQWESSKRKETAEQRKEAESRLKTHQERVKELRKQAAKAKDDDAAQELADKIAEVEADEPELPEPPRVFTSDVTTEHAATMMDQNDGSLAVMSSEGGIVETMAGRYNQGVSNIDLYLQAHAADAVRVDRGSKPPVIMDHPRLTMALAVQPDVLDALSTKPGFKGRGLLGRFLYVIPPSNLGERLGDGPRMDMGTEDALHDHVQDLVEASMGAEHPGLIRLSYDARECWREFWQSVESQLGPYGAFAHCPDWAGKLPGAVARIAALFHIVRHGTSAEHEAVSVEDMRAAVSTGKALASHALAVYGLMGADDDVEAAKVLAQWIKRQGLTEFSARDAHKNHRSRFPRAEDVQPALDVLGERGYIREIPAEPGKPGRPAKRFAVNPAALE